MTNTAGERIKQVFRNLLHERAFEKITIKDICEAAQINRTTFYEYYRNKSDLLCTLQMDYFDKMCDLFEEEYKSLPQNADKKDFFIKIIAYHKEHSDELAYLLNNNPEGTFETNLSMHLKEKILGSGYSKKEEFEFIYHFIGQLSLVSSWILDGMSLPQDELADIMARSVPSHN